MNKYQETKPNCLHMAETTWKQCKEIKTKRVQESITKIDFVKTLENIRDYCTEVRKDSCRECSFYNIKYSDSCQILGLIDELSLVPCKWDIKGIKEVLDE